MGKTYVDSTGQPVLIVGSYFGVATYRDKNHERKSYSGQVFFGVRRTRGGLSQGVLYTRKGRILSHNPCEAECRLVSKVEHVWDNSDGLKT